MEWYDGEHCVECAPDQQNAAGQEPSGKSPGTVGNDGYEQKDSRGSPVRDVPVPAAPASSAVKWSEDGLKRYDFCQMFNNGQVLIGTCMDERPNGEYVKFSEYHRDSQLWYANWQEERERAEELQRRLDQERETNQYAQRKLTAAEQRCRELEKDAERYRWLHNGDVDGLFIMRGCIEDKEDIANVVDGSELDEAVDTAMSAAPSVDAERGK